MELFRQICYGVMEMHALKIIHRDLKPDNILVYSYNDPSYKYKYILRISDFGISKEIKGIKNTQG